MMFKKDHKNIFIYIEDKVSRYMFIIRFILINYLYNYM